MILNRLRVRGKMNLLIALPLVALLGLATPFVITQISDARSAGATAEAAQTARAVTDLIWQLQRERLLAAGFLATGGRDSAGIRAQQERAVQAAAAASAALGTDVSAELDSALTRLGSLDELREAALHRGTTLDSGARAYHAVIEQLIGALRLTPRHTGDSDGARQLTALDALLRGNEQSALRGVALIAAAVTPDTGRVLLTDATYRSADFLERFVQQADIGQAGRVVQVEQGDVGRRVEALAKQVSDIHDARAMKTFVASALAAVDEQDQLRRTVQDQVTQEIADAAARRAATARNTAWVIGIGTAALYLVVAALTVALSRSITRPLRRLTAAATAVADLTDAELARVGDVEDVEQETPRLSAIEVGSNDEVGELALAFNRVQTAATQLVERQLISRRNVALMFSNVAQRTRNLVGRQLTVVDELERDEQNAGLLSGLYRLDHLATRLRRTAENLLVLSGSREEDRIRKPTPLATLLRAALTEIEDYQRVRFGEVADVVLSTGPASDLMLVFAEVLENATRFSPPQSTVEVSATPVGDPDGCRVTVVDHGIGLTPARLAEENQRLVERERLDLAPTNVLGLFVVGRLARRHGLTVQLAPTPGGGTTVTVLVPATLFHATPSPVHGQMPWLNGQTPDVLRAVHPPSAVSAGSAAVPAAPVGRPPAAGNRAPVTSAPPNGGPAGGVRGPHHAPVAARPAEVAVRAAAIAPRPELVTAALDSTTVAGDFDWFGGQPADGTAPAVADRAEVASPVAPDAPPATAPPILTSTFWGTEDRTGDADAAVPAPAPRPAQPPAHPAHEVQPLPAPPATHTTPAGLVRRVPGANLAPGLRGGAATVPAQRRPEPGDAWRARDPELERANFDSYTDAWSRAGTRHDAHDPASEPHPDPTKEGIT